MKHWIELNNSWGNSRCKFLPRAHFETGLVMVSCYGYEIWRHAWFSIREVIMSENWCKGLESDWKWRTRKSIQPEKYLLEVHKPRIRPGGCQKACSTNIVIELFWEIIKQGITIFSIVSDRKWNDWSCVFINLGRKLLKSASDSSILINKRGGHNFWETLFHRRKNGFNGFLPTS